MFISEVSNDFLAKTIREHILPKLMSFIENKTEQLKNYKQNNNRDYELEYSAEMLFYKKLCSELPVLAKNLCLKDDECAKINDLIVLSHNDNMITE